nr:hypothetical protein [Haloarcula amylolytica]
MPSLSTFEELVREVPQSVPGFELADANNAGVFECVEVPADRVATEQQVHVVEFLNAWRALRMPGDVGDDVRALLIGRAL